MTTTWRKALLPVAMALVLAACGRAGTSTTGGIEVVTAVYPLTWVAEQVGGEMLQVTPLTAAGAEPHDLELTASQVRDLSEADLVLYIGGGFQPAVEDALGDNGDPLGTLDLLEDAGQTGQTEDTPGDHEEDDGHGHEEGDPHVWLDPTIMAEIATRVADRLAEIDPARAADYESNAERLSLELRQLDEDIRLGLSDCDRHEIVVSHEAFGHFTERYGLEQIGVAGIGPEAESSPARLAEISRYVQDHDVTTIFFEELGSPEVAETLSGELGIEVAALSPLESPPEQGDYLDRMRANLSALQKALGCD